MQRNYLSCTIKEYSQTNHHAKAPAAASRGAASQRKEITMARILIITTGGTIASIQSPDGLIPEMTSEQLMSHLPRIGSDIELEIASLFHIDSTNMTADHWMQIIDTIRRNYQDFDGFVVCHGTDTMAYTAAVLSYMIQDSPKPIVLTGAQKPIGFEITDAKANLQDSILYAADPHSKGVQIVFAGKVIAGTHGRKIRSQSFAAFGSINLPEVAEINNGHIARYLTEGHYYKEGGICTEEERTEAAKEGDCADGKTSSINDAKMPVFFDKINPSVFLLKLLPGITGEMIPEIFRHYDAIIIESFGTGGIPDSIEAALFEELSKYSPEEKVVALTTQVTFEGSVLNIYEVGRRIASNFKVLESKDLTLEATMAKLMWILAEKNQSWEEIERKFYSPIALDTLH